MNRPGRKGTGAKSRATRRKPGRPVTATTKAISKAEIVNCALELCKQNPLHDVSIVKVAKALGVTPALIHYYLGSRDQLTSSVMNRFFAELVGRFPALRSEWRADTVAVFTTIYDSYIQFGGIAAYIMSHNRFRLFQLVEADESDFGALFFDRVVASVRQSGLSADKTAMYVHLLLQHVLASAYQQASRQLPEDHHEFLTASMRQLDKKRHPNAHFVFDAFTALSGHAAFVAGLNMIVESISSEIDGFDKLGLPGQQE